jgi:hypothetical protein
MKKTELFGFCILFLCLSAYFVIGISCTGNDLRAIDCDLRYDDSKNLCKVSNNDCVINDTSPNPCPDASPYCLKKNCPSPAPSGYTKLGCLSQKETYSWPVTCKSDGKTYIAIMPVYNKSTKVTVTCPTSKCIDNNYYSNPFCLADGIPDTIGDNVDACGYNTMEDCGDTTYRHECDHNLGGWSWDYIKSSPACDTTKTPHCTLEETVISSKSCDCGCDTNGCINAKTYYKDADGDGYGNPSIPSPPDWCASDAADRGYVDNKLDCRDDLPAINPGTTEIPCDGIDNDCSGSDFKGTDADNDGTKIEGGLCGAVDCNDADPLIKPTLAEICGDNIDNNCVAGAEEGCIDMAKCVLRTNCIAALGERDVLHLSSSANAHAEINTLNYPFKVCCVGIATKTGTGAKVVGLSSQTNAHVELNTKTPAVYTESIITNAKFCRNVPYPTPCDEDNDELCVITTSLGETNLHAAQCGSSSSYTNQVCCKACRLTYGQEIHEYTCGDAIDNDCDGVTDCEDPDCAGEYPCTSVPQMDCPGGKHPWDRCTTTENCPGTYNLACQCIDLGNDNCPATCTDPCTYTTIQGTTCPGTCESNSCIDKPFDNCPSNCDVNGFCVQSNGCAGRYDQLCNCVDITGDGCPSHGGCHLNGHKENDYGEKCDGTDFGAITSCQQDTPPKFGSLRCSTSCTINCIDTCTLDSNCDTACSTSPSYRGGAGCYKDSMCTSPCGEKARFEVNATTIMTQKKVAIYNGRPITINIVAWN